MPTSLLQHVSPEDAALVIDFQPQLFMGVENHDRLKLRSNPQIIAKAGKLFKFPTLLMTVTANASAGPFVPEVAKDVFPNDPIQDRAAINAWLDSGFSAVEATGPKAAGHHRRRDGHRQGAHRLPHQCLLREVGTRRKHQAEVTGRPKGASVWMNQREV